MHTAAAPMTQPFDPADAGTPESSWAEILGGCPEWTPGTGSLLIVSPHPDDEVLAAGGLIHSCALAGRSVTIVSVTDGEAAFPQWKGLDLIRRAELKGALRKLCLTHVSVVRMGLPDGKVRLHANRLRNALLSLIEPSMTLVAPYENDGHPDHDSVGKICRDLARSQGIAIARYPVWTWHHGDPRALAGARWGRFSLTPDARRAKARALQCFASQLRPPRQTAVVPDHVMKHFERPYEAFLL
jgi:LmbE family N-acetylglucosaminyl deacetylase